MRLLVCGGRGFTGRALIRADLDAAHAKHGAGLVIVTGYDPNSRRYQGADQIAWEWAKEHEVVCITFPAKWLALGRAAGPLRNKRAVEEGRPDEAMAYPTPGAENPGTNDMLKRLRRA